MDMTDTLLLVDVQRDWILPNPTVTARIAASLPALRQRMNVVWTYLSADLADDFPTSVLRHHLPARFSQSAGGAIPRKDERIFFKSATNAFTNASLGPYLLKHNCRNLYLAGFMASSCVLDTGAGAPQGIQVHLFENLSADQCDRFPDFRRKFFLDKNINLVTLRGLEKPARFAYPVPA